MIDRSALLFDTAIATLSVVCLVLGAALPGPLGLRVPLVLLGIAGLALTFYAIFEALERSEREYYYDPGGGPGERYVPTPWRHERDGGQPQRALPFRRAA